MSQYKSEGRIDRVVPGSPAERAGVAAGDKLVAINGVPVKDVVGYQFHQVDTRVQLQVEREGLSAPLVLTVRKPEQQDLGLEFVDPTFDGIKRCNNHCPFCFVDQNAPGLRRTLDIKDDDFRYSFLYGGFITLTNLKESDWQRVEEERLSPLYVSVHATELDLRRALLGNPRAPDVLSQLKRLGDLGIQVHTQLVVCPGINDGEHLERSISDLAALYPQVQTVGVVPVGLTKHRRNSHYQLKLDMRPFLPAEAAGVLEIVDRLQARLHREIGTHFAFASDEWYLMAGREVPPTRHYEGFPQLENGIGMIRQLLDESKRTGRKLEGLGARGWGLVGGDINREGAKDAKTRQEDEGVEGCFSSPLTQNSKVQDEGRDAQNSPTSPQPLAPSPFRIAIACGEMPASMLERALEPLRGVEGLDVRVVPVKNNTLEGNVACSGLLFGQEVCDNLSRYAAGGEEPADLVFLPRRMFDFQGIRTLDEWRIEQFQERLGVPCIKAEWTYEIWNAVKRLAAGEALWSHTDEGLGVTALG